MLQRLSPITRSQTRLLLASLAPAFLLLACEPGTDTAATGAEAKAAQFPLPPGVTLVETYTGDNGGFSVPFSKYRLDNGLTVILHEDHSDPLAHVDVAYHVGSDREEPGHSGFAHFFEHMMFEGSAHVPQGTFSNTISDAGGSLNGTTNSDRTNYYETIPVNQLEIALWLEADRMGFLLEAVDEEKFEVQRATVKNERSERVDNAPYGRTSETMMKNLYSPEHPYSWPVIGWTADLEAATLDELERFFLRWYGPNNAQLVIGGDIDPQQTLLWVAKYFGSIPRGPEVPALPKQSAHLDSDRYVTLEDNIHLPAIAMAIPTVAYYDKNEAALDAAAKILGQGKASLLYQQLVQSGRAVSAFASHACRELACEMTFVVVQNPSSGESLAQMETAIRETLTEFAQRPVSADDLEKFKAQFESGRIFSMQSVSGKVGALAYSEMFNGDPKAVQDDLRRYAAVTPEDVSRAFNQYIANQPAVVLSIVPTGQAELAAAAPNYVAPPALPQIDPAAESPAEDLHLRTVKDDFDRSLKPVPGMNPLVELPAVSDTRLANGVRLLSVANTETPTVTMQVLFDMGQRDEPAGKAGLANLTAELMNETSKNHTAAEFSEALERIGASITVSAGQYETTISLNTLARNFDAAMALFMERLLEPSFTEEDFNRVKAQLTEELLQAQKSGASLASRATGAVLAGPTHPLSYPGSGLPSTIAAISLDDVKAFYAAHIPSHIKGVLASTSLPQEEFNRVIAPLAGLNVAAVAREPVAGFLPVNGRRIYLVDKPGAAQSSVRFVHPSLPYDALGDFYLAGLMNFNLGGTFDSRLNLKLREEKGWTYGAYSGFDGGQEFGSFEFSAEFKGEATVDAITAALAELEAYANSGPTQEEFQYMQNAVSQSEALRYETPGAKLGLLDQILTYGLPLDYRDEQKALLQATDRATLSRLAASLLQPENLAIIVVGDAAKLRSQLQQLPWPLTELDAEGFVVPETK